MKKKESLLARLKSSLSRKTSSRESDVSRKWFAAQLQNFALYSRKKEADEVLDKSKGESTAPGNIMMPGKIVMFYYDPKHKETLPFYDTFPLGIIVGPAKKGFYMMNLHYLPPVLRASFLDNLLEVLTTKDIVNESSRFKITYSLLKSTAKFNYFKPCFKHYLFTNIKGRPKVIPTDEWIRTVFLESSQFEKASRNEVYRWSRSQIN